MQMSVNGMVGDIANQFFISKLYAFFGKLVSYYYCCDDDDDDLKANKKAVHRKDYKHRFNI